MARTTLKSVDVYPDLIDRDVKAFGMSAIGPCELYSEAIRPSRLPANDWLCRLGPQRSDDSAELVVHVIEDHPGSEGGPVLVPPGLAALAPVVRAMLALDLVHTVLSRLAELRGWDQAVLDAARHHALDKGLISRLDSGWKASPDRRHRARLVRQVEHDGRVLVWIEIERRGDEVLVAVSSEVEVNHLVPIELRHVRWLDRDTVRAEPVDRGSVFRYELTQEIPESFDAPARSRFREAAPPIQVDAARPAVVIAAPAAGPQILCIGGGMMNGVPPEYAAALTLLCQHVERQEWVDWWAAADRDLLEISYWFWTDTRPRSYVRRGQDKVIAIIKRSAESMQEVQQPAVLALRDMADLFATVRQRMALPPHPPLPAEAEIRARAAQPVQTAMKEIEGLRTMVKALDDRLPHDLVQYLDDALDAGATGDCVGALFVYLDGNDVHLTSAEQRRLARLRKDVTVVGADFAL